MKLVELHKAPTDRKWWRNGGSGRVLRCKCQETRMLVRTLAGFCGRCASPLKLRTADEETSERLKKESAA